MVVSEKALKRARDFLNPTVKTKHRYDSLRAFHEYANDLEQAEFYETHERLILLFFFECYLLVVGKLWSGEVGHDGDVGHERIGTAKHASWATACTFAFGPLEHLQLQTAAEFMSESKMAAATSAVHEPASLRDENGLPVSARDIVWTVLEVADRTIRTSNSKRTKWENGLRKNARTGDHLRFPVVFAWLLQYTPVSRIQTSSLFPLFVAVIRRMLHEDNAAVMRVEGLRMLLGWLKASSHDSHASDECVALFHSLVRIDRLVERGDVSAGTTSTTPTTPTAFTAGVPLLRERKLSSGEGPANGRDLSMLNEILAFLTWDPNPDLHSTRFLYELFRDCYLKRLYPLATQWPGPPLGEAPFDWTVPEAVQELMVEYLGVWLLKSGGRSFRLGSAVLPARNLGDTRPSSMLGLAMNDLANLFVGSGVSGSEGQHRASLSTVVSEEGRGVPVASFLLEEVILGSSVNVRMVHLMLRTACTTLPFSSHIFTIKLVLELFRSWAFNPAARRPVFLADSGELDSFVAFYMDSLAGLFPFLHHSRRPIGASHDASQEEEDRVTLVDRVDVYREAIYFFRALALQAFFPLTFQHWQQLIRLLLRIADFMLGPENTLERPFFTSEDALIAESVLGSLLRAGRLEQVEMLELWQEAARVLTRCVGCRGVVEEWCRATEALAFILVRDQRYVVCGSGEGGESGESEEGGSNGDDTAARRGPHLARTDSEPQRQSSLGLYSTQSSHSAHSAQTMSLAESGSVLSASPATASFSAWPDLPSVRRSSRFFQNTLRLLGDPSRHSILVEHHPELMLLVYESLHRVTLTLLKCRRTQPVGVSAWHVPPLFDMLPPALSALLNLATRPAFVRLRGERSVSSAGSKASSAGSNVSSAGCNVSSAGCNVSSAALPTGASHDETRILAWRIAGRIMFRPAERQLPSHYWSALLTAIRTAFTRDTPPSAAEYGAIMQHVGVAVSAALVPGTTVVLGDVVDGMLRFFNEALWSGQSTFSAQQAALLLPATLRVCANALRLATLHPAVFGHFRDAACLPRLLRLFGGSITDPELRALVFSTTAAVLVEECVRVDGPDPGMASSLLALVLEPLQLRQGTGDLLAAVAVCDYLSMLAQLADGASLARGWLVGGARRVIVDAMIVALETALPRADLDGIVVHLLQGPLADWILCGGGRGEEAQLEVMRLLALNDLPGGSPATETALRHFTTQLLSLHSAFPGPFGASLMGSQLPPLAERMSLLHLALRPASTILSFEASRREEDDGAVFVTARGPGGTFTWRFVSTQRADANESLLSVSSRATLERSVSSGGSGGSGVSSVSNASLSKRGSRPRHGVSAAPSLVGTAIAGMTVCRDDMFPLPGPGREADEKLNADVQEEDELERTDVLRELLERLVQKHPECGRRVMTEENVVEESWKLQVEREHALLRQLDRSLVHGDGSEQLNSSFARSQGPSSTSRMRMLLSLLGLALPELYTGKLGPGVELLREDAAMEGDLAALDGLSSRHLVKVGCVFVPPGMEDETALLRCDTEADNLAELRRDYDDFVGAMAVRPDVDGRPYCAYRGGLSAHARPPHWVTATLEMVLHDSTRLGRDEETDDQGDGEDECLERKRHLGNDAVLVVWHASEDTVTERSPLRSDVTSAIIRIRPHGAIPGHYLVTLQTCYERLVQPRRYARLKTDAFSLLAEAEVYGPAADGGTGGRLGEWTRGPGGGVFSFDCVQGGGIVVSRGALGAVVRGLAVAAARQAQLLECVRSTGTDRANAATATAQMQFAPTVVRKSRIDMLILQHGLHNLPYEQFLARLFR